MRVVVSLMFALGVFGRPSTLASCPEVLRDLTVERFLGVTGLGGISQNRRCRNRKPPLVSPIHEAQSRPSEVILASASDASTDGSPLGAGGNMPRLAYPRGQPAQAC